MAGRIDQAINLDGRWEEVRIISLTGLPNRIYHRWQNGGSLWTPMYGGGFGDPGEFSDVSIERWSDGCLHLHAVNSFYQAEYGTQQSTPGGEWTAWSTI